MLLGRGTAVSEIRSDSSSPANTMPGPPLGIEKPVHIKQRVIILLAVSLILLSIVLMILFSTSITPGKHEQNCHKTDYTKCMNVNDNSKSCLETLRGNSQTCKCDVTLVLSHDVKGNVTLYYELESYDQTEQNYSRSRDDEQLNGKLSSTPSSNCGDYAVGATGKPIAPCGLVADTMFNDSYVLKYNGESLDVVYTGLVNKTGYRNPPVNLTSALKDYAKPIHWVKNVWDLDPKNPDNNGFQNEAFIAWMRTDMKRKPALRLDKTGEYKDGLPAGDYKIRIEYNHPLDLYNGTRIFWLCVGEKCTDYDYTECINSNDRPKTCFDTLRDGRVKTCLCYMTINVKEEMEGDVILYYELVSYDQTAPNYASSRDDEQLSGKLSSTPSQKCGDYTRAGGKPIAPCGLVADTMFNDSFKLTKDDFLNVSYTGLVNKTGYQNPPLNVTEAFQNYDKPTNWVKNLWELDPENPDNNGFQNEAFIAWMRTDLKSKPAWRLNPTGKYKDGLPAGEYKMEISYAYPVNRYNGTRIIRLCGVRHIPDDVHVRSGLICFLVALIIIGILIIVYVLFGTAIRERISNLRS